ncbi:hypothetical protein R1flu_022067 [Riccia fluitans]|uniref:Uncharacterized protein n=1 Tax=Riccia fluitans TaxID=41844 RepID=A0ABD1ZR75_9MARC
MGIIAALKKRFKYLYLKDVLDFYQLDDEAKIRKKEQGRRERRRGVSDRSCPSSFALNLSFVQDELEEFVQIDDENNEEFAAAVLEDVEQLLQTMKVSEESQEDVNEDENVTSQVTDGELGNSFVFKRFKSLYKQVVDIEDQLICSEVQAEAEETLDDLRKSFELFQS